MDQSSSIPLFSCNDVDPIKIFIGFYKIISLEPCRVEGRQGREKEKRVY